jgi:ribosomal protein S18 acetylase RimI-like enzyme
MRKISFLDNDLKKNILNFLYKDEMYNAILIELIENSPENLGHLYINEAKEEITAILHIKNDGNSDLTNFFYIKEEGLEGIVAQMKSLDFKKILLAGRLDKLAPLLNGLGYEKQIEPSIFYKLNSKKYKNITKDLKGEIRLATLTEEDVKKVKQFTAAFFQAETEEEIESVTNSEKILAKMKAGVYLLEYENEVIGMARFIGKTKNFAEVTSVYIDEAYRNKGLGKELISHMINIALKEEKIPVLEASSINIAAINTYEAMGFEKEGEYAFEFLNVITS